MSLNFPNNPSVGDIYLAPNGVEYQFDGAKWVVNYNQDTLDDIDLQFVTDNGSVTTNGATFGGLTTHEAGVSVTGGDVSVGLGLYASSTTTLGVATDGNITARFGGILTQNYYGGISAYGRDMQGLGKNCFSVNGSINSWSNVGDGGAVSGFYTPLNSVSGAHPSAKVIGFNARTSGSASLVNGNTYAFYSNMGLNANQGGANNNWAFYSEGTAPNYFAGDMEFAGNTVYNVTALNGTNRDKFFSTSTFKCATGVSSNSGQGAFEVMAVNTGGGSNNAFVFTDTTGVDKAVMRGSIRISSSGTNYTETSDYRVKSNIVPLSSAVDLIKQLNPVSFDINGINRRGFIAHELQTVEPIAVDGVKDETEAIGTLTDWDGTELETEVIEPSAEELTYTEEVETDGVATTVTRTRTWTATGTRDVYQGVDQTKLIPLLTKALQEALERIEALEADHMTLMNTDNGGSY